MAQAPCDLCTKRFLGPAVVGYHSWYTDQIRVAYKQRICAQCAKERMGTYVAWSVDSSDVNAHFPETCPACGQDIEQDIDVTYSTWYRAKNRKDLVLATCTTCAIKIRAVLEDGAMRLENREPSGVRERGAVAVSDEERANFADLPW